MNNSPDKKKEDDKAAKHPVDSEPKKGKSDPQLTELDGLKKGGVKPTVNAADKARDEKGKID